MQINSKLISKPYDYQNNFRTQAKTCGHVLANTVRYQGQIGSRKPNTVKLSQSWPKHALKVTAGPLGALPAPIWPQNLTIFAKTCLQLTLTQSQWPVLLQLLTHQLSWTFAWIPIMSLEYKSFMYFIDPSFRYNAKLRPVKVSTVYCAEKQNHNSLQTNSTVYLARQLPKSAWSFQSKMGKMSILKYPSITSLAMLQCTDTWRPQVLCQKFRKFRLVVKFRGIIMFRFLPTGIFRITSGPGPLNFGGTDPSVIYRSILDKLVHYVENKYLARFDRKLSFQFPRVFSLGSDQSVWR